MAIAVPAPIHGPVFDDILRLVDSITVELGRLVLGAGCFTACVIQHVLKRVVPQAQQVSDERLRLPAEMAHERLKLGSKSDFVLIVEFGTRLIRITASPAGSEQLKVHRTSLPLAC